MTAGNDQPQRVLVVADRSGLDRLLQRRFSQVEVICCQSYLSAIVEAAAQPVRAIVAAVDGRCWRLGEAVRALREVTQQARVVLCCEPAFEPLARQGLAAGADDYLILPPRAEELDEALALPATDSSAVAPTPPAVPPMPTAVELAGLADVLANLHEPIGQILDRLAGLLREAIGAEGVLIRTQDGAGQAGEHVAEPTLVEPIEQDGQTVGQIALGPARGGYRSDQAGRLRHYASLIGSILAAAARQRQWQDLAMTDELTALPNRRYLMQFLPELLERAARQRFRVTVLMFDLDDLKGYNDKFGHATGDELIRETAQLFRQHCRKHDLVARYGGDEFCVVFWDADQPRVAGSKHPSSALDVLQRFRQALQRHEFPALGPSGQGQLTISGGLASFPWDATDAGGLLARADQALMQAKRGGKNRIYLVGGAGAGEQVDRPEPLQQDGLR